MLHANDGQSLAVSMCGVAFFKCTSFCQPSFLAMTYVRLRYSDHMQRIAFLHCSLHRVSTRCTSCRLLLQGPPSSPGLRLNHWWCLAKELLYYTSHPAPGSTCTHVAAPDRFWKNHLWSPAHPYSCFHCPWLSLNNVFCNSWIGLKVVRHQVKLVTSRSNVFYDGSCYLVALLHNRHDDFLETANNWLWPWVRTEIIVHWHVT